MPAPPPDFGGREPKQESETIRHVTTTWRKPPLFPNKTASKFHSTQDLGEMEINRIRAIGFRQVIPYGKPQQDFLIQDEWFSPEYAMNVAYSLLRSNPHTKASYDLITIVDGGPDPSLFQLPAGYVVVERPRIQIKILPSQ